ncbi:hypothetical protein [Cellulomonas triticagri]|uniref:AbiEi antitoxin C-terminal domain-containing protein n=1 Tax=Cellulomonas triticagri TaxID=2483352 RepID=A0A3M2JS17_9CELL|nr:hypothetical protein [Cellulomonas triticagri]RMI13525.1 hypothetical protein EBM89_04240 [Cellulomonas triticagri]
MSARDCRPDPRTLLIRRDDLDPVAWQVLLRDGHLVPLRDGVALPAGVVADPVTRAVALAPLVPPGCVVTRESAAWVHLGASPTAPPDGPVHVAAPRGTRAPRPRPGRVVTEADLSPHDAPPLGGVRVTSPRRTARDLLLLAPAATARTLVPRLRDVGLDLDLLHADVASAAGRRGVREATLLLSEITGRPTLAAA